MPIPTFPTLVTRASIGGPLSNAQMDANINNLGAYCMTLANLLSSSLNPDGTLVAGAVGSQAFQLAAVTLASLNPALLYSIVPVDTDTGANNAYVTTAQGGAGGTNMVTPAAVYDLNGNYVLQGLALGFGYYWTQTNPTNDHSLIASPTNTLSASGAFTASSTAVTMTGVPGAAVTATAVQAAPLSAYKNGQIFFIWTVQENTGPATLNVNSIGPVPIYNAGQPLEDGDILANSLFVAVYMNGAFNLLGGGANNNNSSSNAATSNLNYTINGTTLFSTGALALPTAALAVAHGFNAVPNSVAVVLQYNNATPDATGVVQGQCVPVGEFQVSGAAAFVVSYDSGVINIVPSGTTIKLAGNTITNANWVMVINATKETNVLSTVIPALDYVAAMPAGAISYNGMLLAWEVTNAGTGAVSGRAINMTNNETMFLKAPTTGTPDCVNAAVFTVNGAPSIIYNTIAGIYQIPAVNPLVNVVPAGSVYAGQIFQVPILPSTQYTITPGVNELAYSVNGTTYTNFNVAPVTLTTGSSAAYIWLKGAATTGVVTASVVTTSSVWQPSRLCNHGGSTNHNNYKPVWIVSSGASVSDIYGVTSGVNANNSISAVAMYHYTNGASSAPGSTYGNAVNFTNSSIVNIAAFNTIFPSGSGALVTFFAYNPFNKRIYLMTNGSGLLHIFQLGAGVSNDITAFWTSSTSTRYPNLAYVKSLSIPGNGNFFNGSISLDRNHMSIEINQVTGNEVALVFTRSGNIYGSITRVPWVE